MAAGYLRASLSLPTVFTLAFAAPLRVDAFGPQLIPATRWSPWTESQTKTHGALKGSHGAFLYASLLGGMPPTVYTLDREGKMASSATLEVPDAGSLWSTSFDRAPDGTIVVAGRLLIGQTWFFRNYAFDTRDETAQTRVGRAEAFGDNSTKNAM